jgi:hypothetical protein
MFTDCMLDEENLGAKQFYTLIFYFLNSKRDNYSDSFVFET